MACCSAELYCAVSAVIVGSTCLDPAPSRLLFTDPQDDFSELLARRETLVGALSLLQGEDAVDNRREPARAEQLDDSVELGVASHRRTHDRPLIPEQSPHVGLHDRARGAATRYQTSTFAQRTERSLPRRRTHAVDHDRDATFAGTRA